MDTTMQVKKIFSYLRDIKKINQKIVRNIDEYQKVIWLPEFMEADGCKFIDDNDFSEDWIVVKKQIIESPPTIPDKIALLLEPNTDIKNPERTPKCSDSIKNDPELKKIWESWLTSWNSWAFRNVKKFKTQKFYNDLFEIYQILNKDLGVLDLVIGHGLLNWRINTTQILHPLLITKIQLEFDARTGIFHLKPTPNQTFLDFDMLDNLEIPNRDKIEDVRHKILDEGIDPRKYENIKPILKEITNYISREGRVTENLIKTTNFPSNTYPEVHNCPLLILKKQDVRLWINEITAILRAIDSGHPIPKTIESLVINERIAQDPNSIAQWKALGEELLFPLPANEEQKEIARRLSNNYGIVVQGPPGTGKSHTIVNLICHLLANGKKVLVTSETERALRVLREKIPPELQPLCINVLGNDIKSMKELEYSINKITENLERDPHTLRKEIDHIKHELDQNRRKQAENLTQLRSLAEVESTFKIEYQNESYSLQNISKFLRDYESQIFKIADKILINHHCPLKGEEFHRLLLLIDNEQEIKEIIKFNDLLNQIPERNEISSNIFKFIQLQDHLLQSNSASLEKWDIPESCTLNAEQAKKAIDDAIFALSTIEDAWLHNVLKNCLKNAKMLSLVSNTKEKTAQLWFTFDELHEQIGFLKITLPKIAQNESGFEQFCRDFRPIYAAYKSKGNFSFLDRLKNRESLYIFDECFIDGAKIDSTENVENVKQYLDYINNRNQLERIWNQFSQEVGGDPIFLRSLDSIAEFDKKIQQLELVIRWDELYAKPILLSLGNVVPPADLESYTLQGLQTIQKAITLLDVVTQIYTLKEEIDTFTTLIFNNQSYFKIFDKDFDIAYLISAIEEANYSSITHYLDFIFGSLDRINVTKKESVDLLHLKEELSRTCPQFVAELESKSGQGTLGKMYKNWELSWQWNVFNNVYASTHSVSSEVLESRIQQLKEREKHSIGELVAKQTWLSRILQTRDAEKKSLNAWMTAIRKIGKGTGKYAPVHRKTAQKELEQCKGAIPVWIMPLSRVIENISLNQEPFDVVIFDESSQSDIFALCALFRGKKAVIVGDDKQISPYAIGADNVTILELNKRHIKEVPHRELFDLKTSLYDFGRFIFSSNLMLKEHFRCVPEIIQYSNDQFYGGAIIPLRYPRKDEIFNPAVISVRIKAGYKNELTDTNTPEAEALVNQVVECCKDPQYRGMSIGIISLLGEKQAILIQSLLREKIGEEEFVNRKIVCGDAYAFQGDERDLMFLSLVIATNARFAALTKEDDARRFNVAASRAKNRMWLYHSVDLKDMNPNCVRYSLLSYCSNPSRVKRDLEKVKDLFESEFERDIFKIISSHGYAVTPQVKVGRYRIDLVVEGLRNRLAIECDGDSWHGPEKWDEDLERQQQLERVGWIFTRIRASEFYRDPHLAVQPILKKVEELGIEKSLPN